MKKKKIELDKSELIFLLNILENLADDLYEDNLMEEKEKQYQIENLSRVYQKLNQKFQEM